MSRRATRSIYEITRHRCQCGHIYYLHAAVDFVDSGHCLSCDHEIADLESRYGTGVLAALCAGRAIGIVELERMHALSSRGSR